jgi:hypothetical protein
MQKCILLCREHCHFSSSFGFSTLRAPREFAAIKIIAGREVGPLRAAQIDILDAEGAALNLTVESILALDNQVQILALEEPNSLREAALDERLLGDACATLFAGR